MEPERFHVDWIGAAGFVLCVLGVGIFELNSEHRMSSAIIGLVVALAGCGMMLLGTQ